ncbi:MAG: META domain-containing protein [Deltaproteobacteria bacterium]|nr:META domain-containing protein [Deltaproteobacteria bacterium]MBW2394014.1 META domain-containing protein [Deltaproteobacteria bacterium]
MRNTALCLALWVLPIACAGGPSGIAGETVSSGTTRLAPPVGSWQLVSFARSNDAVAPEVTLILQQDGSIAGSGGCNGYFATWSLGQGQSSLGPIGATRRMCEPDIMDVEMRYFDALSKVAGWLPADAGILLVDEAGDALLRFRSQ